MNRIIIFLSLFIHVYFAMGQPQYFTKQWDKRFGGGGTDGFQSFQETTDGGFILSGFSYSGISGDKTESTWNNSADCWVVKVDSMGNKQWDKRFGGTAGDYPYNIHQTKNNGYIIGAHSYSGLNGDKTQASRGNADFWVIKINSLGTKLWDKRFGGTGDDIGSYILETNDGSYILGGSSNSPANGDKTEDNRDSTHLYTDMWAVKIDSSGNKLWDKRFGGIMQDGIGTIIETTDNGYLLVGGSDSRIGGDKTQDNWDTTNSSTNDGWVVKIDSVGNKLWDKRFGGSLEDGFGIIATTSDNNYVLLGNSVSPADGDKTESKIGYWLVKIDSLGNKLWDKTFSNATNIRGLCRTSDNGYLISGVSTANAGLDKSENNLAPYQIWIVKTDTAGNKEWDKTIFTPKRCEGYALQTKEGCYAVGSYTTSGIGAYKTQPNWDNTESTYDYWVLRFCMDTLTGINDLPNQPQIAIYPNPFSSDISISVQRENLHQATFTISNMMGQVIYSREETSLANSYTKVLDLSYLPNGVYFIAVTINGETTAKRVVKQ